ncbi:hypothetical protein [Streptomyces sp. DH37]|uniref:hypothetical protein n=1 Tax=Streptomyces sp. DH37 TaxID=3040122 RepID=UPI002441D292|nr:hypothetical protein [Streptomyces sp. DH37]MDG9702535.1 hypothetical protein [Streptomyces sp. DH37]
MRGRQHTAHSSRRIRVEHGIAHPENRRAPVRRVGRREHIGDTLRAVAALPSRRQTADPAPARRG